MSAGQDAMPPITGGSRYVAMGSSFAAGPGIAPRAPASGGPGCRPRAWNREALGGIQLGVTSYPGAAPALSVFVPGVPDVFTAAAA
jgi:hypothetical protein